MKVCGRLPLGVGGSLCVSSGSCFGRAGIPGGSSSRDDGGLGVLRSLYDHAEGIGVKVAVASVASVLTEVAEWNA